MYHRIVEVDSDPWSLCVTQQHFLEQLEVLRKHSRSMQLRELVQALDRRAVPHRTVVVTFDDGYADNLYNAKPLLERYDIPATAFLVSGQIRCEREFWWDELERLLLQPGRLPDTLCLNISGKAYQWELGEAVDYKEADYLRHRRCRVWEDAPTPRHSFYLSLWRLLRPLSEADRLPVLDELLAWAGSVPRCRTTHRTLSLEEVGILARGGLVDVGSHTVSHPPLSELSLTAQRDEIHRSKADLEEAVGHSVISFAYPYGIYAKETVPLVREAGFVCACTVTASGVGLGADCFQLPRFEVQDWDGEEFGRRLSMWLGG